MYRSLIAVILLAVHFAVPASGAQFFGPTPYLSAADSPFDLSGLGTTFWLEDFEDGELNTPGASQLGAPPIQAIVRGPSVITDSVDADDGVIDGHGDTGHSLQATAVYDDSSFPPVFHQVIAIAFDEASIGFQPNTVGFVWTDGGEQSSVTIRFFDASLNVLDTYRSSPFSIGDDEFGGTTEEDRFFGVFEPLGIYAIGITSTNIDEPLENLEIDHLQYGRLVPEPGSAELVIIASLSVTYLHRKMESLRLSGCKQLEKK